MRLVTDALVARSVDYGEADRICTLLTRDQGKLAVLARAARRSRKRYGGALSLFVIGEATIKTAGRGSLLALERFDCREDLGAGIGHDVVKVGHGSYMLELARELWGEGQPDPECFELVCAALRTLSRCPQGSPSLLRAYELQLLGVLGLAPSLERCAGCGATAAGGPFDLEQGGVLCAACTARPGSAPRVALDTGSQQTLLELQRITMFSAAELEPEAAVARQIRDLMIRLIRHTLGKDLKTLAFLVQLAGK